MHPKQEQEIRREVRRLISYAEQFSVPKPLMATEVESRMRIELAPGATPADYAAAHARIRAIIQQLILER